MKEGKAQDFVIPAFKDSISNYEYFAGSGVEIHSAGILCARLCIARQNLPSGVNVV